MDEFSAAFRADFERLLNWRRDVRYFRPDPLPSGTFERLVELAALAPSVGLSQPWRFVLVEDAARRRAIHDNFTLCNEAALGMESGERAALYARLKLAGLDRAPAQFALCIDDATEQGHFLGRRTMPETAAYSAVTALFIIWLAARAEGIGLGWVSIIDPANVLKILEVPSNWSLIGYFCMGYPEAEDDLPALQRAGWEQRGGDARKIWRR